jgi:hypothetical protein
VFLAAAGLHTILTTGTARAITTPTTLQECIFPDLAQNRSHGCIQIQELVPAGSWNFTGVGSVMCCEVCQSGSQGEFTAEMMIHFSGLQNIDNPGVPAFPKIAVCLDCGFSRFSITDPELSLLARSGIRTSQPFIE